MNIKRISLEEVADLGKNLFYRDYKTETDFFDTPHFTYLSCATYATMINTMFGDEKTRNKQSDGFSYVNLSGPWIVTEQCEIKEEKGQKFIETSMPCFCFDFDAMASSIHSVVKGAKGQCGDLMRISNKDIWKLEYAPVTNDIYYYQLGEKIILPNLKCDPGKLTVHYLPALLPSNPKCTVPETMVDGIITTVLQIMFAAKKETPFIKIANDGNPNPNPQKELADVKG